MYILLYIMSAPAFLGEYVSLSACKSAIREIYATKVNPPGERRPELNESIDLTVAVQRSYVCIPKSKG